MNYDDFPTCPQPTWCRRCDAQYTTNPWEDPPRSCPACNPLPGEELAVLCGTHQAVAL